MLFAGLRRTGCVAAAPAPPRVNPGLFNPTALSFSVLLLSEGCQPCLPFHLSLSLRSFCSLALTVPKPDPDSPAGPWKCRRRCSHPRQPGVCALAGQRRSFPGFGILRARLPCRVTFCLAALGMHSPSETEAWSCAAGFPDSVRTQAPNPKQAAEPRCLSSATWPHVPHACDWQVSQSCWARGNSCPTRHPGPQDIAVLRSCVAWATQISIAGGVFLSIL